MAGDRSPLRSWGYPDRAILDGNVFPSGKPPFAPFPSVTDVLNAALCPVAALHDLMHGDDTALLGDYPTRGRGDLFHQFVSVLKLSLRGDFGPPDIGPRSSQEGVFRNRFLEFASRRGFGLSDAQNIWQESVEPWVRRKLLEGELDQQDKPGTLFFEITVGAPKVPFQLGTGRRHYPLRGRIDEIDLAKKRIVERTTKSSATEDPPLLKDLQVWLLWSILSSLPANELPVDWQRAGFKDFELVVETPNRDFVIDKSDDAFLKRTHSAYAWISDIAISESPGVAREVHLNAACTPDFPHSECSHVFRNCFTRNYPFPQSRPEIQRVFRPWYRLLLWERMWRHDLWYYQLLSTPDEELVRRGFLSRARIISTGNNQAEIAIVQGERTSARGYDRFTLIPFGTVFCGQWANASLVSPKQSKLLVEFLDPIGVQAGEALLLPTPTETSASIMTPPPDYLITMEQRSLSRVEHAGLIKPEKATLSSVVQLLESVFGAKKLRR